MIGLAYWSRVASGKPDPQVLYEWTTAIGAVIQDGIILALVLAIAGARRDLLALRRPRSIPTALRLFGGALVSVYIFEIAYTHLAHPGNEQGLTPAHWEPRHALPYIVNGIAICTVVPFVEELTYRGLGYSLLERFGRWPAIVVVGLLFGLAHGLVAELPIIALFGGVLAWLRARTNSVYPGMLLHAGFNLVALIAAVTIGA